jgi:D-alanyl-lipoteichoic acid acyltransferase DltB (MBOAT superfamily)
VWLLTGIWHGANWTFVAWGLLYFFILLVEKLTGFADRLGWLSHVYTMLVVIIAWVIFRAGDLKSAVVYIGNMFGIGVSGVWDAAVTNYIKGTYFVLIVSCVGITPLLKNIFVKLKGTKVSFIESLWIALIFVLSLLQLVKSTYNPFIYFNF